MTESSALRREMRACFSVIPFLVSSTRWAGAFST